MASRGEGTKSAPAPVTENPCPAGSYYDPYRGLCTGDAYFAPRECGPGYVWDYSTASCVPVATPVEILPPDPVYYPIDPLPPEYLGPPVKQPPIDPIEPVYYPIDPIYIDPPAPVCPNGYYLAGYDAESGSPLCLPNDQHVEDPVYIPQTCPQGYTYGGMDEGGYPICNPIVAYPIDPLPPEIRICPSTQHWVEGVGCVLNQYDPIDDPQNVFDPIDDPVISTGGTGTGSGSGTGTGSGTTATTTPTPGLLDGILDANGKLFGFEPIYVIGAAAAVALLVFSGGGKK